jgi:hypothetical protein
MRALRIALVSAAFGVLLLGSPAWAQGWHGGHGGGFHGGHDDHFHSHVTFGFGFYGGGPYYWPYYDPYYYPPYYYPPAYYPPAAYYPPPATYYPPPAATSASQPLPGTVVREGRDSQGNYCREYQNTATINGQTVQTYGTACLGPDGHWHIVG